MKPATKLQPNLFGYTPSLFDAAPATDATPTANTEAAAYAALMEDVFGTTEDEEGFIELLASEFEAAQDYRLAVKFGGWA